VNCGTRRKYQTIFFYDENERVENAISDAIAEIDDFLDK